MYCRCVYIDSYEDILPLNFIMGFYVTQVFYTDFRSSFSFILLFPSVKILASPSISFFLLVETSVSLYYLEHYLRFQLCYFLLLFHLVFDDQVVSHWWRQYSLLFWIDTIAMDLVSYLPGIQLTS